MSLPASVLLRRGVVRRCPVCGHGKLFRRWVQMATTCPGCGLHFHRAPGHWLGSWFLSVCLVQAVLVGAIITLVLATWPDRPSWIAFGALVGVAVGVPLAFFPFSRTIWTAIDLVMRPLEWDEGVDPGVELAQLERTRRRRPGKGPTHRGPGAGPRRPPAGTTDSDSDPDDRRDR